MVKLAAMAMLGLTLAATPAMAQGGYGGGMGGMGGMDRGGRMGGGRGGMGGYGGADPALMQPPPAPAEMTELASLDSNQSARYAELYAHFMENTAEERDSLQAVFKNRREAMAAGMPPAASTGNVQEMTKDLAVQRRTFNSVLKSEFTKDQWKAYQKWLDQKRKEAPARQRRPMGQRGGGGSPMF